MAEALLTAPKTIPKTETEGGVRGAIDEGGRSDERQTPTERATSDDGTRASE
ncbi:hypothetical protein [Haloprofundus salilacus]|uniref:hypothetical protein n=1 Tax=Haloprofundus salilacus TaxID=2876190 RepID=UPI001CCCEDE9|nr:hypothetical protein [Haloprofundus salilacus]